METLELERPTKAQAPALDYHALNAMLNLYDEDGKIQFDRDRQAAKQYFLQHVNQNTVFFHNLREKLDYLVGEGYYEREVLDQYSFNFVRICSTRPMRGNSVSRPFSAHSNITRPIR